MLNAEWFKSVWNSTESLTSFSFWAQLAAVLLAFPTVLLTVAALVLTLRKDRLDRVHELEGQQVLANTQLVAAQAHERAASSDAVAAQALKGQKALELEAEQARTRQRELEAETARARVQQEQIRKHNLELQSQVEKERIARLQIEERLRPRALSAKEQAELTSIMKPLGAQRIDFFLYPNDTEILGIAEQVASALRLAGCSIVAFQPLGGGNVAGMRVEFDPSDEDAGRRARALASALTSFRLDIQGPIASLPTPPAQLPAYLGPPGATVGASIRLTIGKK